MPKDAANALVLSVEMVYAELHVRVVGWPLIWYSDTAQGSYTETDNPTTVTPH